jgi:HEAT repeat protein
MGLFKACLTLAFASSLIASSDIDSKRHALYMVQNSDIETALHAYQNYFAQTGHHDFDVLQRMGLVLLQHGIHSDDPTIFTMTLFGAGLSGSAGALEILEKGLFHSDPQIQMVALHFIAQSNDDQTDELLNRAMSSDFLSTRLEAAFYMAQKKHPRAVGQIEGLMYRLPPIFRPLFPSLFALIGTSEATCALRRLLDDPEPQVRIESILNIARLGRDDLLPILRKNLTHSNIAELEACSYAIGVLKDSSSLIRLKKLAHSPAENVKIAAILALHALGDRSCFDRLIYLAQSHNIYAMGALGQIPGGEEALALLTHSDQLPIRLNAAISLLQRRDERCLQGIEELLIRDQRDLAFYFLPSVGRTMAIWKAIPSAELRSKDQTLDLSLSLSMREQILRETIYLPQPEFLKIAKLILEKQQNDLVPCLITLLKDLRTPEAIDLLKIGCSQLSAPFIRDYCHLALFDLKEEGPYGEYIKHWVLHQKDAELIRLRPMLPWKMRLDSNYSLTPDETSRLLIESFLAIATDRNIDFLVEAILKGNPQNRYALFGLLMRATE